MNIGTIAERAGIPCKTIRYYESIGLIPSAHRRANGYRTFTEVDMHRLHFIKRERSLGFSFEEVRDLLDLWRNKKRSSAAVKTITGAAPGSARSQDRGTQVRASDPGPSC